VLSKKFQLSAKRRGLSAVTAGADKLPPDYCHGVRPRNVGGQCHTDVVTMLKHQTFAAPFAAILVFGLPGCGGAESQFFPAALVDASQASSEADASTPVASGMGGDASGPVDVADSFAALDAPATANFDSAGGVDSAVTHDASRDALAEPGIVDSGVADAGSTDAGPAMVVHCPGAADCLVPSQVCCHIASGNTCTAANACMGLSIPCDDSTDCPATGRQASVCCITPNVLGIAASVTCRAAAACAGPTMAQLCDPAGNSCPNGTSCVPSTLTLVGFDFCR
jgi:hypothetical protein